MRHIKKVTFGVIGIAALAVAATALAFWTASGSGSGSGKAASANTLTVSVQVGDGSHPGDGPTGVPISGTVTNGTSSAIAVTQVVGDPLDSSTHYVTVDGAHSACNPTDFTLTMNPIAGAPVTLAANGGSTPFTGRLVMSETGSNQDACQGATLTVHVIAS